MKPVLVGSRALAFWNPEFKIKDSTDWDVISYEPVEGCEWHSADHLNNEDMMGFAANSVITLPNGQEAYVMGLNGLAIMKRSHLWRDLNFDRHITMYHKFGLRNRIDTARNTDNQIVLDTLKERTELTMQYYKQWKPTLAVSKEEFFDDAVVKYYDHDYLHTLVAPGGVPRYTMMLSDGQEVLCSKEKWDRMSALSKLRCVTEETEVIALERFMIPSNWNYNPSKAYWKALNKVCTTLTSGWFRDFAIDHYDFAFKQKNPEKLMKLKSILPRKETI